MARLDANRFVSHWTPASGKSVEVAYLFLLSLQRLVVFSALRIFALLNRKYLPSLVVGVLGLIPVVLNTVRRLRDLRANRINNCYPVQYAMATYVYVYYAGDAASGCYATNQISLKDMSMYVPSLS